MNKILRPLLLMAIGANVVILAFGLLSGIPEISLLALASGALCGVGYLNNLEER